MRKILLLFSALLLSVTAMAHDVEIDGIFYNLDEENKIAEVTYKGERFDDYSNEYIGSITIPSSINYNNDAYSVTSIGKEAFKSCTELTMINFPNSITYIGDGAFYYCTSITSIQLPNSITDIGSSVFEDCSGLNSVTIGDKLKSIGDGTFYGCNNLTSVTIGQNVESIGTEAFYACYSLTSITIPNSVTSIGDDAFGICTSLTSVTISNNLSSIGRWAFSGCSALTSITIPNSVTFIGDGVFKDTGISNNNSNWDNGVLYIDNCLIEAKSDIVKGSYIIKEGTRVITSDAFADCVDLTSVTIPNSVTSIGENAFKSCKGLTSIIIPNSVTSIGGMAFYNCSDLTSVTIGENVESIGAGAFWSCKGITSITIPNSVTSIGQDAFKSCKGLTTVTIGEKVESIHIWAFTGCEGVTSVIWNAKNYADVSQSPFYSARSNITSFTFGNKVELIPAYLCSDMSKLNSITIPNSVTSIGPSAFRGCTALTSVSIGEKVEIIGERAFGDCNILTSITIPNSVISIGEEAFYNCSDLTSVSIGEKVENIGQSAFKGCSALNSVTIPNSVNSIEESTFEECSGLTSVTIGEKVGYIGDRAFSKCSSLTSITIPNSVTSIGLRAFYSCSGLTSVGIGENVENIGQSAFEGCSDLTSITIPNSVTTIGDYAFSNCSSLSSITWNAKNCTNFEDDIFKNTCTNITSFILGDNVEHLPARLCSGMSKLTEISIPTSVTSIGSVAFNNCSGLTKVNYLGTTDEWATINFESFSSNPTYYAKDLYINNELLTDLKITTDAIKQHAFYNCQSIKSVEIGNSVTSIGEYAFFGCNNLSLLEWNAKNCADLVTPIVGASSITFGNEVEYIPTNLCSGSDRLKEVFLGNSVSSIGDEAFYECINLKKVINLSELDIVKGETTHGYVAYYADVVGDMIEGDFIFDNNDAILAYIGDCNATTVEIPLKTTLIYYDVFKDCNNLTTIVWNAKNCADFNDNDESPFYNSRSNITSFTFGNEVEHIPARLCYDMNKLSEITIPNSVTSIGSSAFFLCDYLTKANYLGTVDQWAGIRFEGWFSNPTYYARNLYINNKLLTDIKLTSANSIKEYTFVNCASIKTIETGNSVTYIGLRAFENCFALTSVIIGESVRTIDYNTFAGCDKLKKVIAYPTSVPNVSENSFAHYNAALYVPCDVYDDYFFDDVFGTFKVTECIAAEEVEAPEMVEIEVDEDNNAIVTWPSTDGANSYELVISKDDEVFCTLLFNENGQLTSIDFGKRSTMVGFQFTVTGLDEESKYNYQMSAKDENSNELKSYNGTFTTNGYEEDTDILETLSDANITISNGLITCLDSDYHIYNTVGQDVTSLNGSLQSGIYVVTIGEDKVKVMVK